MYPFGSTTLIYFTVLSMILADGAFARLIGKGAVEKGGREKLWKKKKEKESSKEWTNKKVDSFDSSFNDNYFIGTQAIVAPGWNSYRVAPYEAHSYGEPGFDMLSEFRESVALTGSNHFKFKLSSNVCKSYQLNCQDSEISSLRELSEVPEVADTFADPRFRWYHLWMYSYNLPKVLKATHTQQLLKNEFEETYEWAVHMLQTYQGSNKVFFVGNWEGDWELMWSTAQSDALKR